MPSRETTTATGEEQIVVIRPPHHRGAEPLSANSTACLISGCAICFRNISLREAASQATYLCRPSACTFYSIHNSSTIIVVALTSLFEPRSSSITDLWRTINRLEAGGNNLTMAVSDNAQWAVHASMPKESPYCRLAATA